MSSKDIMDDTYFPTDDELHAGIAKLINYNAMLALINECLVILVEIIHLHYEGRDQRITTEMRNNIKHNLLPQIQRIYEMEEDVSGEMEKLQMLGRFGENSIH